jgi:hypothetical protein
MVRRYRVALVVALAMTFAGQVFADGGEDV